MTHRHVVRDGNLYRLFDSEDFLFRTATPTVLDAPAIDALLDPRTRLVERDGEPIGLWSFRSLLSHSWGFCEFTGFYQLDWRLSSDIGLAEWVEVYQAIEEYLGRHNQVTRITWGVPEVDELGHRVAAAAEFVAEGVLAERLELDRKGLGIVVYARTPSRHNDNLQEGP